MKKFLIITGIVFVSLFAVLLTAPFLFKNEIKQAVLDQANKSLNAIIYLEDVQISFIRNFPNVSVKLENLAIVGKDEFKKDTLLSAKEAFMTVDIESFFNDKGYIVNKILLDSPRVYAHVLKNGKVNWDIVKPDTTQVTTPEDTTKTEFKLSLKKLAIEHAHIVFKDEQSNIMVSVNDLNHTLSGDLTAESTILATTTKIDNMTFRMENVPYLSQADFSLEGDIKADLKNNIFTVKGVKSSLNAITLNLDGWLKILPNGGYDMDMKIGAAETQFKDILSLIPAIYSKDFEDIQTKGKVKLSAFAKGVYNDSVFPAFGLKLLVSDAWFKYPALPKSIDRINIAAEVSNPGGSLDYTKVNVSRFAFVLGNNPFEGNLKLATPMSDPDLDFFAKGKLNLGMVKEVYPMDSIGQLSGVIDANVKLKGKMSYYDKAQYDKFFFDGKLVLSNMVLKTKSLPHDLEIKNATLIFNPKFVDLPVLQIKVGKSDLSAKGHLENFIPYVLKNEVLKGSLQTSSQYLSVDDFMSSTAETTTATADTAAMTVVAIPSNLDFTLNSSFAKVIYDKIVIANAKGSIQMADSKLTFKGLSLSAMGGDMVLNGTYNTQNIKSPDVDIDLKINDVVFGEMYKQVTTIQQLAPIFAKTDGKFSATMKMQTKLADDMMPVMNTLTAKGVLQSKNLIIKDVKVLQTIANVLKRDEFKNPEIEKVAIQFEVKEGRVYTEPFDFAIADTKFTVEKGSTGIDQTIDYTMKVNMPTPEATIVKLSKLGLKVGGTFTKPKVSIQTKEMLNDALSTLKQQAGKKLDEAKVVAKQQLEQAKVQAKEQLNTVKEQAKENIAPELKKAGDNIKESGKKVLNNLFGR